MVSFFFQLFGMDFFLRVLNGRVCYVTVGNVFVWFGNPIRWFSLYWSGKSVLVQQFEDKMVLQLAIDLHPLRIVLETING